ncbi:hypothetical protein [Paenibacillus algorifonticola]|uniref:hypothetical protein n=1 Tax=Paenibacillus algorifonticola TaxID=684063 RepID=UPI001E37E1D3|nr:hypothetical protein [Paenibacillus algorifonticola]
MTTLPFAASMVRGNATACSCPPSVLGDGLGNGLGAPPLFDPALPEQALKNRIRLSNPTIAAQLVFLDFLYMTSILFSVTYTDNNSHS